MPLDVGEKKLLHDIYEKIGSLHERFGRVEATVNQLAIQTAEHERRIIQLERMRIEAAQRGHRPGVLAIRDGKIDPDLTPHGGIRLPPDGWERIQHDYELNKARAEGAEAAIGKIKANFRLILAALGVAGPAIAYAVTHFLKL